MNNKTKIKLLTGYSLSSTVSIVGLGYLCYRFGKQHEKDQQMTTKAVKIVVKFVEHSPVAVCQKVWEEVQWDMITSHIDFTDEAMKAAKEEQA